MKLLRVVVVLFSFWTASVQAWHPTGWVYCNWPWAYEPASDTWRWFKTDDVYWAHGYPPADGWRTLGASGLAHGWSFFDWPFAYAQSNDAWHFLNEGDTQWNVNMTSGAWSLFGAPLVPDSMPLVPAGSAAGIDPDFGAYSLTVDAFHMDRGEISRSLWNEVYAWSLARGFAFDHAGLAKATNHPVESVNWYDSVKWCNARSLRDGRTPVYYTDAAHTQVYRTGQVDDVHALLTANGFRLPSAEQWEYAARGGSSSTRYSWGNEIRHEWANYYSYDTYPYDTSPTRGYHPAYTNPPLPYTSPSGSFAPNAYGLVDLTGNVFEWCFNWHPSAVGTSREARGGGWTADAPSCRIGERCAFPPGTYANALGFRTVLPFF